MTAAPGQIALRKFDHDEAIARYAAGESGCALAREYGVSATAVYRVVNPRIGKRMAVRAAQRIESLRIPCRGGCGVLVYMHRVGLNPTGYCQSCLGEKRAVIRHGTENEYSYGCRCVACTAAATEARRRRRHAARQVAA